MDPYVQLVDELNIDLAYPIVASTVILSIYREVINGVRNKRTTSATLTKIHKKLLRYISSYSDDTPEERTWALKSYMKSLGFSEAKINWAIEDAVQFQNGAFSRTSQNPLSRKIPRHKVMISAFLTVTIALITVSILAHNVLYDSPTAMYFAFATLVLIEAASFFWAYKSAESHRSYSTDNSTYYFISAVLVIFVTLLFASLGYLLSRLLVTIFFVTILACTIAGAFCYLYSLSTLEVPPPSMRKTIDLTFSAKGSKVYFTIGVYEPYELIAYQHISIVTKRCRSGVSFLQNVKKISYICLLSFEINPADSLLLPHRMDVHINNNTLMVNQSNYYTFV